MPIVIVRPEQPHDAAAIGGIHRLAFGTTVEADLVDALREQASPIVSLVAAADDGAAIGHILFSPVTLAGVDRLIMGLAPMAVRPSHQRQGVGSSLVWAGLDACRELGAAAIVVLGHPEYYPRFGFAPASRLGLACEYDVPDEVFMALELSASALQGRAGTIRYHPAFGSVA